VYFNKFYYNTLLERSFPPDVPFTFEQFDASGNGDRWQWRVYQGENPVPVR